MMPEPSKDMQFLCDTETMPLNRQSQYNPMLFLNVSILESVGWIEREIER